MKPLTATAILLFAVVNFSAATTLHTARIQDETTRPAIAMNAGGGTIYLNTVDMPAPSAAAPALVQSGPGPNGPCSGVVGISILSGAVNDQVQSEFSPQVLALVL